MSERAEVLMLKRYVFLLFMILFVAACAAPRENPSVPPPATLTSATVIPTAVPFTPTSVKAFVPKQNDLIFIEFFAIT
jgi:uncharacterized lipoprotein YajG